MEFECHINNVVLNKTANFFIATQFKRQSNDIQETPQKYRTQVAYSTNRPKFNKNQFRFRICEKGILKIGAMHTTGDSPQQIRKALVFGVNSMKIQERRLKQLPNGQFKTPFNFLDRGKQVGSCTLLIKVVMVKGVSMTTFKPLISRVLYSPQINDPITLKNNFKLLSEQLQQLHQDYHLIKGQEERWEKLFDGLEKDEQQLKDQIYMLEKINSKISNKLSTRESREQLQTEIQMLKSTQSGRNLLLEKMEYFEDRIFREQQQNEALNLKYQNMRSLIEGNLAKAQQHASKLKGKQLQEFEIENNKQILQNYDQILYQFKCNEQTIDSLAFMSKKSEYTANQAALFLSQVTHKVKLAQLDLVEDQGQQIILKKIQQKVAKDTVQKQSEEQQYIYKIKLEALQKQVQIIKNKIKRVA